MGLDANVRDVHRISRARSAASRQSVERPVGVTCIVGSYCQDQAVIYLGARSRYITMCCSPSSSSYSPST